MRKFQLFLLTCGIFFCLLLASERQAYAYVDPGSGLFLLQGISSAFLGIMFFFRRKLRFGKRRPVAVPAEAADVQ